MSSNRSLSGFSLAEVVISTTILALLFTLAWSNTSSRKQEFTSEGLAQLLATNIQSERQKAVSDGQPRAMVFSTKSQITSLHKACVMLAGFDQPRSVSSLRLGMDSKDLVVFSGYPDGSGEEPVPIVLSSGNFVPEAWLPSEYLEDKALIFLPDGSVTAHGLKVVEDSFWFVVALGAETAPGRRPHHTLLKAGSPYTVKITRLGMTSIEPSAPGIDGQLTSLELTEPFGEMPRPHYRTIGNPPEFAQPGPGRPSLEIQPPPSNPNMSSGVSTTMLADDILSLKTYARDADGDDLSVKWTVEAKGGNKSQGDGKYSASDQEMGFDLGLGVKNHITSWRPPRDAQPGDRYRLTVLLDDGTGKITKSSDAQIEDVEVVAPGRIFYNRDHDSQIIGLDGTKRGPSPVNVGSSFRVSADGTRYVTGSYSGGPAVPGAAHCSWTARTGYTDGEEVADIRDGDPSLQIIEAGISPGGEKIAFLARKINRPGKKMSDPFFLYTSNFDGTDITPMRDTSGSLISAGSHFSRANILMAETPDVVYGPPLHSGQVTFGKSSCCAWSPDGNTLLFAKTKGTWERLGAGVARYDVITKTTQWVKEPIIGDDTVRTDSGIIMFDPGDNTDYYNPTWGFGNRICMIMETSQSRAIAIDVSTGAETVFPEPAHVTNVFASPIDDGALFLSGWTAAAANVSGSSVYKVTGNNQYEQLVTEPGHIYGIAVTR